ncbi:TRAF-type zinc finger domain-containing protein 1 isoform X2 [Engystomops pustulosus]|uniref:TRAF-type zinc finger domain-containing protein 1 isoform X2 n=1 Tax=Engystomops pustulosus TaxID=76066 RepID=UPI003AFA294A
MASSAEQDTRLCGNCKRDIPADNFTIHEIHCRRNIAICKLCNEPIPRSDMEEHYDSEHAPVTCKCNKTVEKCSLEEHEKSSCSLRLVKCQFCELEVIFNTLENHEDYCGSRTEPCEKCGVSVMIKELGEHPAVCGKVKLLKKPVEVRSWADSRQYEMPLRSAAAMGSLYPRVPGHVPERFYGKSILTQSSKKFDDINQNFRGEQNRGRQRNSPSQDIDSPLYFFDDLLEGRPNTFSSSDLSRQNNTRPTPEPDLSFPENNTDFWHDFYCKDNNKKTNVREQSHLNYFSSNESKPSNSSSVPSADDIQLPCEFCEELFPEQDLILHQSGCRPNVFSSVRRRSPSPPLDFTNNIRSSPPPDHSPTSVLIPCEFCGVLLEGEILFHHQDKCDMGPNIEQRTETSSQSCENVYPDASPGDEHRSYRFPAASNLQGGRTGRDSTLFSRNPPRTNADNTARDPGRIGNLYRSTTTTRHTSLQDMRKRNMEENARMMSDQYEKVYGPTRGASNRVPRTRNQPKKNINTNPEDVDKEE